MPTSPLTAEKKTVPDLTTVAGVAAELKRQEGAYEVARKAVLAGWQGRRRRLRALLAVLKDQEGEKPDPADSDSDEGEK